jgi:hypothetical protein
MKEIGSLFFKCLLVLVLTLGLSTVKVLAQGDPPDDGGPTPPNPPPAEIPIDGGASLLIAGGVAYGLKKLRDRRKK